MLWHFLTHHQCRYLTFSHKVAQGPSHQPPPPSFNGLWDNSKERIERAWARQALCSVESNPLQHQLRHRKGKCHLTEDSSFCETTAST